MIRTREVSHKLTEQTSIKVECVQRLLYALFEGIAGVQEIDEIIEEPSLGAYRRCEIKPLSLSGRKTKRFSFTFAHVSTASIGGRGFGGAVAP